MLQRSIPGLFVNIIYIDAMKKLKYNVFSRGMKEQSSFFTVTELWALMSSLLCVSHSSTHL